MSKFLNALFLCLFIAGTCSSQAATKTWTGAAGTNDWFVDSNWNAGVGPAPVAGDDVVITNVGAAVLLTNSTPYLGSLTISNTLVFSNWDTKLSATNVTILSGGIITLPLAFTTNQMSNNVYFVCSNFTLLAGGKINVDGLGYTGGIAVATTPAGDGYGPGAGLGNAYGVGASHGGRGGSSVNFSLITAYPGAQPCDSLTAPVNPGSGGGGSGGSGGLNGGGAGGGAVRIDAPNGNVIVSGTIMANAAGGAGGGAGGSIYITCRTFDGTNGVLSARGGTGYPWHNTGGHGGGGRIAVLYNTAVQTAIPTVSFMANPGTLSGMYGSATRGDPGTIYVPDNKFIAATLTNFFGQVWGFPSLSFSTFTVSNTWVRFPAEGFQLTVTGDLSVKGSSGMLQLGGGTTNLAYQCDPRYASASAEYWYGPAVSCTTSAPILNVGGNLILTNGGSLVVFSAMTNAGPGTTNYGALVSVTNDILVANGSYLYPYSHPTNGGAVLFRMRHLRVDTGGSINANGKGYAGGIGSINGYGPGGGVSSGYSPGGGYGGTGAGSYSVNFGGWTYGSPSAPVNPGSGGGSYSGLGGNGGGLISIQASGDVTMSGSISADGSGATGGGGSGGGIYITCNTIDGSNGVISASGGGGGGVHLGAGGGGRIAVKYNTALQSVIPLISFVAYPSFGPAGHPGDLGTLWFPDNRFLMTNLITGRLYGQFPAITSLSLGSLAVTNTWIRFPADGFQLTVTNDLVIGAAGKLDVGGSVAHQLYNPIPDGQGSYNRRPTLSGNTSAVQVTVGGNLVLTNGGILQVFSAKTNSRPGYGAMVSVAAQVNVASSSFIYPQSHPTDGGSVLFRVNNLLVDNGGAIDADGRGFAGGLNATAGYGPGHSHPSSYQDGAGYGGRGGNNVYGNGGGITYGSSNAPVDPGSGGGGPGTGIGNGRAGGGVVWIQATRTVTVNGTIGAGCIQASGFGAGSGGGIYISCKTFAGSSGGLLTARGGNYMDAQNGAGGGGRIAVWRQADISDGAIAATATVAPGTATTYPAVAGTIVWGWLPIPGTVISAY